MSEKNPINKIIRSKRRTLSLQITSDASLVIRAPQRASLAWIQEVVQEKLPWILEKQRQVRQAYRPAVKVEFMAGEEFLYLGEAYKLQVGEFVGAPLNFDGRNFLLRADHRAGAKNYFISWYKRQARKLISQRVEHYAGQIRPNYASICITGARTRWGSCGPRGTLNFTWRLIMAPIKVIDYVVVHELAHLEQGNHSCKFWQRVDEILPHYRTERQWLKSQRDLLDVLR